MELSAMEAGGLTLLEKLIFFILLSTACVSALRTLNRRFSLVRSGRLDTGEPEDRGARFKRLLRYVPGQWCNIQKIAIHDIAGIQHLFLFFGAIVISLYYPIFSVLGEGLGLSTLLRQLFILRVFASIMEIFAVLILIALWWGLVRRVIIKPSRLGPDYEIGTFLFITIAAHILLLSFIGIEALRANPQVYFSAGPVSGLMRSCLAAVIEEPGQLSWFYHIIWWVQTLFVIGFTVYIPFSQHQHAVFSGFNIYDSSPKLAGVIDKIEMNSDYRGLAQPSDLTRKQLLELYGCTQCGRCQVACPAQSTGKPLSPRKIIQDMRKWMDTQGHIIAPWKRKSTNIKGHRSIMDFITSDEIWSCTTCMACVEECPAFISALDKIIELRRHIVLEESQIYSEVSRFFREMQTYGDTFGKGRAFREDWVIGRGYKILTEQNETDVLFWVGCQTVFNDRNRPSAVAFSDILSRSGIDFAVLGKGEMCCGDPLRRMGNEYQFQQMAHENINYLKRMKFKRIVTGCPHCYNMIKNEYPQLGGNFDIHHTIEMLVEMIRKGKVKLSKPTLAKVVYHDPCYLSRGNKIFKKPRQLLDAIDGTTLLEPDHHGDQTFCCGGGGGHMWIGGNHGTRINEKRVKELTAYQADTILTACPYCLVMLEDAAKSLQNDKVKCLDVAEYVRVLV